MDGRAVENKTASATGWVEPSHLDCSVNIVSFCLNEAAALPDVEGRW